ncbi:LON peptidase substrate-binding domain-containing protein [Corallococcus sp. ZKHCc1 1396]|uniref:LON peptidase substrate-binding domain-containing protein n=1 Tax=Corallococcus soli TaxID=2710757 RepID=A0ABR9PQC2_9BACT|nr:MULTISPECIES: LON peptidase substrate-binding domain-containing protein [Corallococcus]MBE4750123.1 LON peptidase substrate-binding domain-containing protein [Corallococcus soli]MCY1036863.1 LON peptidase substrate-binding domain-containing protein [Corallococcus sp. BB11-1]
MTAQERVERAASALKVFPLPSAVLFPHTVIPLHIFEPRYRDLVRDALATDRVLALGQLETGWEGSYEGRPTLQPMLCAGVIVWDEQVEDGRYNILLQGVSRVRLVEELPADKLYRQVRAQPLPDLAYTGPEEEQLRQAVFELAGRVPPSFAENLLPVAARAGGGMLADVVASAVVPEPTRRQELLVELDVRRRLEMVLGDLSDLLGQLQPMRPSGPLN